MNDPRLEIVSRVEWQLRESGKGRNNDIKRGQHALDGDASTPCGLRFDSHRKHKSA